MFTARIEAETKIEHSICSFAPVEGALCATDRLGQPAYQPEPLPCAMSIQEELARCSYLGHAYRPMDCSRYRALNQN